MTEKTNKDNVQESKEQKKHDLASLKTKLNELNSKKEEWFNKKEDLNKEISKLVTILKAANPEIEAEKKKEKELMEKRNELNKQFREQLNLSKDLVRERNTFKDKFGRGSSPGALKNKLEKLEYTMETEALPIEKEKKLMRQIKELRKAVMESEAVTDFKSQMGEISQTLTGAKEQADKYHLELKELLKENKKKFKDYLINSRKVNELKKEQRQAFKKFIDYKTQFSKVNAELKKALKEAGEVPKRRKKRIKKKKEVTPNVKKIQTTFIDSAKIIEEKVKEVEDKIKKKKKLTTKDLIAMQGSKK